MLWLLLSLIPNSLALICYSCGDFSGSRATCSQSKTCSGTRCIYAYQNNGTSFAADCFSASTTVNDFCWTDLSTPRTLCACKTEFCNIAPNIDSLAKSETNLLPEVDMVKLFSADPSITTTVPPTTSTLLTTLGVTGTVDPSAATGAPATGSPVTDLGSGGTMSSDGTTVSGEHGSEGTTQSHGESDGTTLPTGSEGTTASAGETGTPAHDSGSSDPVTGTTAASVETTTKAVALPAIPIFLAFVIFI